MLEKAINKNAIKAPSAWLSILAALCEKSVRQFRAAGRSRGRWAIGRSRADPRARTQLAKVARAPGNGVIRHSLVPPSDELRTK